MSDTLDLPKQDEHSKVFTGCLEDTDGVKRWFIDGAYGREGGLPAIEHPDGSSHWYAANPKRGQGFGQRDAIEHRDGAPAVIRANGDRLWFFMGELHRDDDLPAVELANGAQKWFVKGKFIRQVLP